MQEWGKLSSKRGIFFVRELVDGLLALTNYKPYYAAVITGFLLIGTEVMYIVGGERWILYTNPFAVSEYTQSA